MHIVVMEKIMFKWINIWIQCHQISSCFFFNFSCGRYYHCTCNIAADTYRIEIQVLLSINHPSLFSFLVINGFNHLNIRDTHQPPSYLWSFFHNEDEANIEPQNVVKSNSVVGAWPIGLNQISAYPNMSHAESASNISTD